MTDLTDEQYQAEYDAAIAKLDAAEAGAKPEAITAPVEAKAAPEAPVEQAVEATGQPVAKDPLDELKAELEQTKKALKDTQAWGTKNSQRLAEIERERAQREREAQRPQILDLNPELVDAIRYVSQDPAPRMEQERQPQQSWQQIVEEAHPGIFDKSIDPELENVLVARREALGDEWFKPLVAIREIAKEKIAFAERQVGKRFSVESAKLAEKSAMSVPGSGGNSARIPLNSDDAEVLRMQKMSDKDFAREVRRVKGY